MAYRNRIIFFFSSWVCFSYQVFPLQSVAQKVILQPITFDVKQQLAQKYFQQIERESKIPFLMGQRRELHDYLQKISSIPLPASQVKIGRHQYNLWKTKLIADWVHDHGRPWPSVIKLVKGVYRPILWEVHHIYHLSNGGPNLGWNVHPLEKEVHRQIIHGQGSIGEVLHGKSPLTNEVLEHLMDLDEADYWIQSYVHFPLNPP